MTKKLTLSVDETLVAFAHDYAKHNHLSISGMVEGYLSRLRETGNQAGEEVHQPVTASLYGLFENEPIPNKESLRALFHEKDTH